MANGKQSESRAADVIKNWIRTRYTIEFLGTWEMIHNPNFKVVEFDHNQLPHTYRCHKASSDSRRSNPCAVEHYLC